MHLNMGVTTEQKNSQKVDSYDLGRLDRIHSVEYSEGTS